MLTSAQRAMLTGLGLPTDLQVRCWFTLTPQGGGKAVGQWEEGVVTRVDDDAFFVSYPDAQVTPCSVSRCLPQAARLTPASSAHPL